MYLSEPFRCVLRHDAANPELPPTTTVNQHELHIDYVPNFARHRTWTITEHLGPVIVGHPSLRYENGTFTTNTSTGVVSDPDWRVVLDLAFARG